ncbi:MAG: iron-containing alcohol dehydrogenase [Negativicutes bacterium]|nr:iron-containing alcohol dehydrogenase [Negativicutes bacterium]
MTLFEYHNPVRLVFGCGQLAMVGKIARQHGGKALIVTSGSSARTGLLDRVVGYLKEEGLEVVVYGKIAANPLTTMALEAAALARSEKCDVVIGLGGGSSMDAAKATAFMAVNEGDINEYIFGKPGVGALPSIMITTTAGTGSEGNCAAVLTNPETHDKKAIRSPFNYPKASIIDPELLTTLSKGSIAGPGLDALFHAIESYISQKGNPMTDMFCLQAIALLAENLPAVYDDSSNLAAWEKVVFANTLAGMAIDATATTLAHGMEHPVSGLFDVAHGEGLAALFLPTMKFACRQVPQKFAMIAKAMGTDIKNMTIEAAAEKSIELVGALIARVNMVRKLRDFGVTQEHLDWLTANAFKTMKFVIDNNPRVPSPAEVKEIYRDSL